jgi:hypothetical protein
MSARDFQAEVLKMLSEVNSTAAVSAAAIEKIKVHLKELNGKVAAHEKQLNERSNWCPLVENVEDRIEEGEERIRNIEDYVLDAPP